MTGTAPVATGLLRDLIEVGADVEPEAGDVVEVEHIPSAKLRRLHIERGGNNR